MLLEECLLHKLFSCTYTKCEKINLLFRSHTHTYIWNSARGMRSIMQHLQLYNMKSCSHRRMETKKSRKHAHNTFPYMSHQRQTGNIYPPKLQQIQTFRTMQTKTAFMKKFRTNLTWEIHANIWSYVLSSCLLSVSVCCGIFWKVMCVIHKHDCILRTCERNRLCLLHYNIITINQWSLWSAMYIKFHEYVTVEARKLVKPRFHQ